MTVLYVNTVLLQEDFAKCQLLKNSACGSMSTPLFSYMPKLVETVVQACIICIL